MAGDGGINTDGGQARWWLIEFGIVLFILLVFVNFNSN